MYDLLVAFDPGDRHVGMALFKPEGGPASVGGWQCVSAVELEPDRAADRLAQLILDNRVGQVAIESWVLYPSRAKQLTGSEMLTSQLIGVLKYLVGLNNRHHENHQRMQREKVQGLCRCPAGKPLPLEPIRLEMHPADVKTATASLCKSRGIQSTAKANKTNTAGDHPLDAELIGWAHLFRVVGV